MEWLRRRELLDNSHIELYILGMTGCNISLVDGRSRIAEAAGSNPATRTKIGS